MSRDEPRPWVRLAVVLVLRVGLGMILLTSGMINYLAAQQQVGMGGNPVIMQQIAIVETAIGLALVLGFFTAAAAVAAMIFFMFGAVVLGAVMWSGNGPAFVGVQHSLLSTTSPNVMLCAAVLWFSPVETNGWSLDRLLFTRRDTPSEPPAPQPPAPEPSAAPPPGARAAKFLAGKEIDPQMDADKHR